MDITEYITEIEELASRCIDNKVGAQELLEALIREDKVAISRMIKFRNDVLTSEETDQARALLEAELFPQLEEQDRIACITLCIDLQQSIARKSIIRKCEKYEISQEIFKFAPDLFNHVRREENGHLDRELINLGSLRQSDSGCGILAAVTIIRRRDGTVRTDGRRICPD
jgi:hypothetical protein